MPETPTSHESAVRGAVADEVWDVDQEWLDLEAERTAAEEFAARFAGPSGDDDVPECLDDPRFTVEVLLSMRGPVSAWDLVLLASVDPATLSTQGKLAYLRCVEAVKSMLSAMESRGTVAMAGTDASNSITDRHVAMEVAQLRRVGEGAAASGIATARALHVEFPKFLAALEAGEVSEWHCRVVVSETAHVTDRATIAALQDRLLPKAKAKTPTQFRTDVRKAVADLDAKREAERVARARAGRYVTCKQLPDGMGYLGIVTDWPTISAMHQRITGAATAVKKARGGAKAVLAGDEDALMDACRADAMAGLLLGTAQPDGSIEFDPTAIPISLTVVMDLPTLRGEADRVALVDGEPMPAGIAREYADAARWWRRVVTDPVTGHLLDYGREQYLPARWREHVIHRDGCRAPGCTVQAESRLQADHPQPFPQGPTSAANGGGLCIKHHQLKTSRYAAIEDSAADGSATWITAWRQRITVPPRPFLHDPADHPPNAPEFERTTSPGSPPDPPDQTPRAPRDLPTAPPDLALGDPREPAPSRAPARDHRPAPTTLSPANLRPDLPRIEPLGLDLPCPPPF
ncbi:MAG: DUF222 domain-containing protein [Candidatus Nanopelagicales bacterium]